MKQTLILLLTTLLLSSCFSFDEEPYDYYYEEPIYQKSQYEPVIVKRELIDSTTNLVKARQIVNSGKIYIKGNLLFINEVNEGFHILDNTDPKNPINKAFLKVLGSSDLTIKNNNLYINNAVDLITLKPDSALTKVTVTKRIKNVFPQMISPDGYRYNNLNEDDIIINWQKRK